MTLLFNTKSMISIKGNKEGRITFKNMENESEADK